MDADLQHPPECLPEIVEFDEGYEVISMVRTRNKTAGLVKNVTSAAFYKLINHLSDVKFEANASDFFCGEQKRGGGSQEQLPGEGPLPAGLCPEHRF